MTKNSFAGFLILLWERMTPFCKFRKDNTRNSKFVRKIENIGNSKFVKKEKKNRCNFRKAHTVVKFPAPLLISEMSISP